MVTRAGDLHPPTRISETDFDEICGTYRIAIASRQNLRADLDLLVEQFAALMRGEKQQPSRQQDRKNINDVLHSLERATYGLSRPQGASGRSALAAAASDIGTMLSAHWLRERFPDDESAPRRRPLLADAGGRTVTRVPIHAKRYDIEEQSLTERIEFVRHRPADVIATVVREIELGLQIALRKQDLQPGAKGGRKPLTYRHCLIMNLAEFWTGLDKSIVRSRESDFVAFAEAICECIGWPTDGIFDAVIKALDQWEN
jgi:hypothetical protein